MKETLGLFDQGPKTEKMGSVFFNVQVRVTKGDSGLVTCQIEDAELPTYYDYDIQEVFRPIIDEVLRGMNMYFRQLVEGQRPRVVSPQSWTKRFFRKFEK